MSSKLSWTNGSKPERNNMNYEKSNEKCNVPFGVYHVNHEYLQSLRKNDNNVIDPENSDIYCGPVYHATCDRGIFGFFVPVDMKEYEASTVFLSAFEDGVLSGFLDFKKMIPVVHERFLTPANENKNLEIFCKNGKEEFEICGEAAVNAQKSKTEYPFIAF